MGLILYGIPNPWNPESATTCLYTNGDLPDLTEANGFPAELVGATKLPIIAKLPGRSWGADPRRPVGSGQVSTVTLQDDNLGTLGTLFLQDPDSQVWGINSNRLSPTGASTSVTSDAAPTDDVPYYIRNECVTTVNSGSTTSSPPTHSLALTRGLCGSVARVHAVRPSDFSAGEDGSQDRVEMSAKPNFDYGFYAGLYLFQLDASGSLVTYELRRGVVQEAPRPTERPYYDVTIRALEDHLSDHKIGACEAVSLGYPIVATQINGSGVNLIPQQVILVLSRNKAERFFNEPCGARGSSGLVDTDTVTALNTRLRKDPLGVFYHVKVEANGDTYIYEISKVEAKTLTSLGTGNSSVRYVCVYGTLKHKSGSGTIFEQINTAAHTQATVTLKPWWTENTALATVNRSAASLAQVDPPKISLRLYLKKTVVQAFLALSISDDGSTTSAYDSIIGGVGAGLPAGYLKIGAAGSTFHTAVMAIPGNTSDLLLQDQRLEVKNDYFFDLTAGVSFKEWLLNELIASQLLLGTVGGKLTLRSWVHEVAPTVTLNPVTLPVRLDERLPAVKRLDLAAGILPLDLAPAVTRQLRFQGAQKIKPEEIQAVRYWRIGLNLTDYDISHGDIAQLVWVFHRLLRGSPFLYEVPCTFDGYLANGLSFGDACTWSDSTLPTPSGLGVTAGSFIVVGVNLDMMRGIAWYKLLRNTLYSSVTAPLSTGRVAPALAIESTRVTSSTTAEIKVYPVAQDKAWDTTDYSAVFDEMRRNGTKLLLSNVDQAPIGEKEDPGSLAAHLTISAITFEADGGKTFTVSLDSSYLRGSITDISQLLTPDETKLILPTLRPAESELSAVLIEADAAAGPTVGNFLSIQPKTSLLGVTYTFKA